MFNILSGAMFTASRVKPQAGTKKSTAKKA